MMPTSYQNKISRTFHPNNWKPNWFLIGLFIVYLTQISEPYLLKRKLLCAKAARDFDPLYISWQCRYGTAGPSLNESITGFNFARTNGLEETFRFRVFFFGDLFE